MLLGMLLDTGKLMGALLVLAGVLAAYPRTRRTGYAILRFFKLHASPWVLAVFTACQFFPGQLDDAIVIPILLAVVLRTKRNRMIFCRYVTVAWNAR